MSAGACSRGHAREASRSGWPLPRTRGLLFSSLSLGERWTRSASEGKEFLASEFGAGIGARDAKLGRDHNFGTLYPLRRPNRRGRHHPVYR